MEDNNTNKEIGKIIEDIPTVELQNTVKEKYGRMPTLKQVEFAKKDLILDNHTRAYIKTYQTEKNSDSPGLRVNASRLAQNTNVALAKEEILNRIKQIVPDAVEKLHKLVLQNKNLVVSRQACDSILDRAGYKEDKKLNLDISVMSWAELIQRAHKEREKENEIKILNAGVKETEKQEENKKEDD